MQKRDAEIIQHGKVYLTKWFSAEHREEGHEKVQRYTSDIFFGAEHRMRKEEMEEQFNERSQTRLEICSRCSKRLQASSEDRKHTSGGVLWQSTAIR